MTSLNSLTKKFDPSHALARSILALSLSTGTLVGCADTADLDQDTTEKSSGWDEYNEDINYWDTPSSSDQAAPEPSGWGESELEWESQYTGDEYDEYNEYESDQGQTHSAPIPNNPVLGGVCAPGCIWSAYAVSMGAQTSEALCGDQYCACVVNGDIWSSCVANDDSANYTETSSAESSPSAEPSPAAEPSPSAESNGTSSNHSTYPGYDSQMGMTLADTAYGIATRRDTVGYCYTAVADAIESLTGPFLWGASAYMAADQLAQHPRFTEGSVSDLRSLPAGAVVVWARGTSEHGHISIALGDGREASDHVASQMTHHYGGDRARVFFLR